MLRDRKLSTRRLGLDIFYFDLTQLDSGFILNRRPICFGHTRTCSGCEDMRSPKLHKVKNPDGFLTLSLSWEQSKVTSEYRSPDPKTMTQT